MIESRVQESQCLFACVESLFIDSVDEGRYDRCAGTCASLCNEFTVEVDRYLVPYCRNVGDSVKLEKS